MSEVRKLTAHIVPGSQTQELTIGVEDEPGSGGAHHRYMITGLDVEDNQSYDDDFLFPEELLILFQNGPIPANGVNGVTIEALLAICKDRLDCFQAGPFASDYNQKALDHINAALASLHQRTIDRMNRQVEGKEEQ